MKNSTFPQTVTAEKLFVMFLSSLEFLTNTIENNLNTELDVTGLLQGGFDLAQGAYKIYTQKELPVSDAVTDSYVSLTHLELSKVNAILQALEIANLQYNFKLQYSFSEVIAGLMYSNYQLNELIEAESEQVRLVA